MKLIVGLGNIGKSYSNTRHNIGFVALDAVLKDLDLKIENHDFDGDFVVSNINDQKVIFIKPTTLMNLSGKCVGPISKFYKIKPEDIIVIHDDLDLSPGQFKIRTSGSAGGHNGLKSIISDIGSEDFIRFKIGIGHPTNKDVVGHVLGKITEQEAKLLKKPIEKCVEFIKLALCCPINQAISKVNQEDK